MCVGGGGGGGGVLVFQLDGTNMWIGHFIGIARHMQGTKLVLG